jgi:5-methylcytosine-specific restriction endonuclease McrA
MTYVTPCGQELARPIDIARHAKHHEQCRYSEDEARERRLTASRAYGRQHRADANQRNRDWPWRKASAAVKQARRQARRHGVPEGELTKEMLARLHLLPCSYCGALPANGTDHVRPFRLGGLNELSNLVPACDHCNKRRGAFVLNALVGKSSPAPILWPPTSTGDAP